LDKKGISEIVGYVILIVIAVGLSVLVYSYLRFMIPKEIPECEEGISLIVQNYSCLAGNELSLTLLNKGLFRIDGAYINLGEEGKKIRVQINKDNFYLYNASGAIGINPGEEFFSSYGISNVAGGAGNYILEIEPLTKINNDIVFCKNAITTQPVICK
jgi:flagellin-like protein